MDARVCVIQDYNDTIQVRNCRLVGLRDLKGIRGWVRDRIAGYMNELIDLGVAGFRVDAAKHMWPQDIVAILGKLRRLNTRWFPDNTTPFVYQEVRATSWRNDLMIIFIHHKHGSKQKYNKIIRIIRITYIRTKQYNLFCSCLF